MIVGAIHQKIDFLEYLPLIIGSAVNQSKLEPPELNWEHFLVPFTGYDPSIDATISNVFSTAAFRFGHAAIRSQLLRLDENFQASQNHPNLMLHEAFFSPWRAIRQGGLDPIIRGMVSGQGVVFDFFEKFFELRILNVIPCRKSRKKQSNQIHSRWWVRSCAKSFFNWQIKVALI